MKNVAMAFLLLSILSAAALAHTVTLNLAMNIGNRNSTIHVNDTDYNASSPVSLTFVNLNKKYVSANNTTTIAAIVSAGTLLNVRINNTHNSTHYLLQMTQDSDKNRFLIAMTNGTYSDIDDRLSMVEAARMVSSAFGKFVVQAPASFITFIRLEYVNVDITSRAEWSGIGQLRIRNKGPTSRNIPNVTLEVVI